jgi:L-arabinose isomerase
LYLELYDKVNPGMRETVEAFAGTIAKGLTEQGLEVAALPVCRLREEFLAAVRTAERQDVCALVTLHLAYSPSLESADALARTDLPIIVCDTTPAPSFAPTQDPKAIMTNHGIHGVQDMCNLLVRNGKTFAIEAGHYQNSDVLRRVAGHARAAWAARCMRTARTGRVGRPFDGMGDFAVDPVVLKRTLGVTTVTALPERIAQLMPELNDPAVADELAADRERYDCSGVSEESHLRSIRAGLAVRKWINAEQLTAFTANFLAITKGAGLPVMPFLEASKSMQRGIGYAGEGDVLTASLVGALAQSWGEVSFTEMFCPDWESDAVFLSHMGEMNLGLAATTPKAMEKPWSYTDAEPPVVATAAFRPGPATLVNLAPGPDETYTLIASAVAVVLEGDDVNFGQSIRGWFRPKLPLPEFLAAYSRHGGTHHAALVYGDVTHEIESLARFLGLQQQTIG